jgi:tRNA U34 5-methylaminomethyl-2-thiouridine-forming methyltransferase MnmC
MKEKLIITGDGSHTIYVPGMNEHYHSRFGALTESRHIFINAGLATLQSPEAKVLEVGFGTGLNALLTAQFAAESRIKVTYTTLEKEPLDPVTVEKLNYGTLTGGEGEQLFTAIHNAPWNLPSVITGWFTIEKVKTDLTTDELKGVYDIVYFDAFGPDKQPEMWSETVLGKIAAVTRPGSVFVTYSAKGTLKRMLRSIGYEVSLLPGPPGKRVITRAVRK